MISSTDGYCTIVTFKDGEFGTLYKDQVANVHNTSQTDSQPQEDLTGVQKQSETLVETPMEETSPLVEKETGSQTDSSQRSDTQTAPQSNTAAVLQTDKVQP